ncbi:hypothetical protein TK0860 [Thermococcus kodakarensis KOD1]|uniref:Uncharacterized protein n=1 Tax=Thermococcus kodakarensis (strain ATCC BAA-918 / JCM 12380 / KOD1) TaxID=69014 RepID=Q5JI27_THEKO|nr:hypothetical protein [Thermococcus kodakarensis]WCN29235.1 hypothetical protein POG15_04380 [Thermococcus kodakarensis]WCN31534.1 hypothetical protein POG21_04380 [Thermococcus kodakarensis]BAD85049.1 hypothetical protein TK0860 [Thermococcus kodakarensis KOD1]
MGASEIVIRIKVPPEWEGMSEAIREKVILEVSQEIQRRIEEARKFEEILKKAQPDEEGLKKLEEEIKESIARRYGAV